MAMLAYVLAATPSAFSQEDGSPIIIGYREDLKLFEFESFRASIEAYWRYRNDESTDSMGVTTKSTETLLRETLNLSGEAYIGNPNFVKLDLDINLQLSQEDIDSNEVGGTSQTAESINEYDFNAIILQRSDTPLTLYSRRSQVLLDRQFADSLDSITIEHGARLTVRSELMPSQFHYFHREQTQTGRFSGSDFDLTQDSFAWQGRTRPTNGHRVWWDYTFSNVEEAGQLQVANSFTRHDAFVNHTYDFGTESQNSIRSSLRVFQETGKFPIDRLRLDETLRLEHAPNFETKYVYMFDRQDRRNNNQTIHRGIFSFRHDLFESLTTTGQMNASRLSIDEDGFESTEFNGNLDLKYHKIVPLGLLDATVGFSYSQQNDGERGSSLFVTDEPHTFGVSGMIVLSRRNIVASSIVVTDATGVIIYIEGSDYTVREFADSVEIRRTLGGNIAAGQSVLVTYEIGPEPESTTDTLGVGFTVRYRFVEGPLKGLSPYMRYRDQSQDRSTVGLIALPDNDFYDLIIGLDYDIGRISLTAEHQIHDSTLSPFETTRFEGRYTNRISNRSSVSISAYYQETDRVDEDLQTTITNITARWTARPTDRIRSSLVGVFRREEDNTGTDSNAFEAALDLNWRHRQTMLYCSLRNSMVDSSTRESTFQTFTFGARREF